MEKIKYIYNFNSGPFIWVCFEDIIFYHYQEKLYLFTSLHCYRRHVFYL